MYIICKECDTIFRLDESLVKPTGSQARCCQCRNVFVIYPPEPEKTQIDAAAMQAASSAVPQAVSEATLDQELEGIDLAELDSILEQDRGLDEEMPVSAAAEQDTIFDSAVAELDESDLDLDFEIEPEGEEQQPEQTQEAAADMDIDDLDLDLDMDFDLDDGLDDDGVVTVDESQIEAIATEVSGADVLSTGEELERELDQLDLSLDEDEPAKAAQPAVEEAASDDLDFLAADLVLEEHEPGIAAPEAEDQELELSIDDDEQPAAAEAKPEEAMDDFDLSDLDAVLGLDEEAEQASLDLPELTGEEDIELSLEDDVETAADVLPDFELDEEPELKLDEESLLELDEEPVLDLDEEPALELDEEPLLELDDEPDSGAVEKLELEMASDDLVAEASADDGDDLDLSDLDALLGDAPDGSEADQEPGEALDLELELDDDAAVAERTGDELEDLSFELDSDFKDEPILEEPKEEVVAALDDGEIDLSDIEQMLEADDTAATLGLTTEPAETAEGEVELGDADEIDLTEIEAAIDAADKGAGKDISFEEELFLDDMASEPTPEVKLEPEPEMEIELDDLALELESDASTVGVEPVAKGDELDLSDLGDLVEEQGASTTTETIDTGDIELEFEVSDGPIKKAAAISQTVGAETGGLESTIPIEETVPLYSAMEDVEDEISPFKKKKRSGGKGLLFLLILVLLGGAGYLFYAVSYLGIEIPHISDYLNPKPKDPAGVLNLATLDINSKFIQNEKSGRLFVVTGKVRNGKETARRLIRLQGQLFTKGKVLAKTEFTYGGVSFNDQEISQQAVVDIKKTINNPSGPAATVKVLPGQTVPFMIVFSDLPEGLDEFAIEVISSMQAQ